MKLLKILLTILAATLLVAAIVYITRTDPIAIVAGKRLSGNESPYPSDWSFSNDYMTIAIESRPQDPHSVTTLAIVHQGALYIPAQSGSTKAWTHYVLDEPRVRLKIGDTVYLARADRVLDLPLADLMASAAIKYPQFAGRDLDDPPPDTWLFRISQRR